MNIDEIRSLLSQAQTLSYQARLATQVLALKALAMQLLEAAPNADELVLVDGDQSADDVIAHEVLDVNGGVLTVEVDDDLVFVLEGPLLNSIPGVAVEGTQASPFYRVDLAHCAEAEAPQL